MTSTLFPNERQNNERAILGWRAKSMSWAISALPILVCSSLLAGCSTYATSELKRTGDLAATDAARPHRGPADIQILETDPADKHYRVIGTLTAKAHIVTSWVRFPDRDDVDRELREAAAKAGADAVIKVHYWTEPQGFENKGTVVGEGIAVYFSG